METYTQQYFLQRGHFFFFWFETVGAKWINSVRQCPHWRVIILEKEARVLGSLGAGWLAGWGCHRVILPEGKRGGSGGDSG